MCVTMRLISWHHGSSLGVVVHPHARRLRFESLRGGFPSRWESVRFCPIDASIRGWHGLPSGCVLCLKGSGISLPHVFGIVAVKYVLLPFFGILIVKAALYLGLVHADPLYVFVLLLQFAVPPAMNTGMIL
ncbi:hypothetical protein Tco_0405430 [Tanacetum coccineum]